MKGGGVLLLMTKEEFLEHAGVKGMRWGVLRGQAASGNSRAQKTLAKEDRKWDKELNSTAGWVKVNNAVADKANGPDGYIAKHNANPKYKDVKDFSDMNNPVVKSYFSDFQKIATKAWNETLMEEYGESPSGRFTLSLNGSKMEVVDNQAVSHSAIEKMTFNLELDLVGRPIGIKVLEEQSTLTQSIFGSNMQGDSMMSEDEFLQHYGVAGMKWGKRKGGLGDRVKGAALDSIQRRRATNQAIASGKGKVRDFGRVATYRLGGVPTLFSKKIAAKRVDALNASEARIKSGNANTRDIISGISTITIADLLISRTDERG